MKRMLNNCLSILAVLCLATIAQGQDKPQKAEESKVGNFSFLQISDIHISPHPETLKSTPALRGKEEIEWFVKEADKPQELSVFNITTPVPAFVLATGDLAEYGFIDKTYDDFRNAFSGLKMPMYLCPGNHDNTWSSMTPIMRKEYGKDHYAFEKFGFWFIGLNSATPHEPVPSLSAQSMRWLREKLRSIGKDKPVFIFLHHPVDSSELAPAEWGLFYEVIRSYNIMAIMYGHGHSARHKEINGIDCFMGGTTFDKSGTPPEKRRAGYAIYSVQGPHLRVAYRFFNPDRPMIALLEKKITPQKRPRIEASVSSLEYNTAKPSGLTIKAKAVPTEGKAPKLVMKVDGKPVEYKKAKRGRLLVNLDGIAPGGHILEISVDDPGSGKTWETRTVRFFKKGDKIQRDWIRSLPGSAKAGPLLLGNMVVTATTDGTFMGRMKSAPYPLWEYPIEGELLTTPGLPVAGMPIFGAGDGNVYAIVTGEDQPHELWKYNAGTPVHGAVATAPWEIEDEDTKIEQEFAYFGDSKGRLHAVDVSTGKPKWVFERASYAIEGKPVINDDTVFFGAWDGYMYALNRKDGSLKWKKPGPKASEKNGNRYYGPTDCGPIIVGDKLFVCDRGYCLAPYTFDGEMGEIIARDVAAIAAAEDGKTFFARCTGDRVAKYDASGKLLWEAEVPAGRFPVPPTESGGKLYVCSNTGMLSVLDVATGKILWDYQVTPGFYVMAPVAVDEDGDAYIVGMDGVIYCVGPVQNQNAPVKKATTRKPTGRKLPATVKQ